MKRVETFYEFVLERMDREDLYSEEIIATCLQAMQEGVLDVCAQNIDGQYVWSCYTMTPDQWNRACGLLQRAGIANCIFWGSKSFKYDAFMADIEYFWTDLEAVERFCEEKMYRRLLVLELDRRRTWHAGLRRSWLAACTRFD